MAFGPSKHRKISQKEPREPNLIPIMNLFIVVIPMLMTIMVSVHLAMIEIALPTSAGAGGGGSEEVEEPPAALTLGIWPDRFELKEEGTKDVITIPVLTPEKFDFVTLDQHIAEFREKHPKQNTFEILPDPTVRFDILLRAIDVCKSNNFPNIKYLTSTTKYYRGK